MGIHCYARSIESAFHPRIHRFPPCILCNAHLEVLHLHSHLNFTNFKNQDFRYLKNQYFKDLKNTNFRHLIISKHLISQNSKVQNYNPSHCFGFEHVSDFGHHSTCYYMPTGIPC
jgi:hypothetical protein